jgi:hypothetical protein
MNTPFVITVVLTLRHISPITFKKGNARFFVNPLQKPGLEFINIRTGETQAGMPVLCMLNFNDRDLPVEEYKDAWLTLLPGQPNTLDASIKQCGGEGGRIKTIAKQESGLKGRPTSLKWPMVHRLRDGETFEIRLNDDARIKSWIEGTLEDILRDSTEGKIPMVILIGCENVKYTTEFPQCPKADASLPPAPRLQSAPTRRPSSQ